MEAEKFPLTWPSGLPETENRTESNFKCTFAQALSGLYYEMGLLGFGLNEFILSTNVKRNKDDKFTSSTLLYPSPGVAIYFTYKGQEKVIACDKWKYLHENLRAVEKSINAIRGLERWGCTDIVSQALPNLKQIAASAGDSNGAWWDILGIPGDDITETDIREAYRLKAKYYHPDNQTTGNAVMFDAVKRAYEGGLKSLKK